LDTLRFLETILESHPDGISKPDFVKYFVGTSNSKYLTTIMSLAEIFKSNGSEILEPFSEILSHTEIFHSVGESNTETIRQDLQKVESEFRSYMGNVINKPFEDESVGKTRTKLTKEDKKRELFLYLIEEVSEQVSNALDQYGLTVLADEVRSNPMFLVDAEALTRNKLIRSDKDLRWVHMHAQDLAKTIMKRLDVDDNEYNYNLLANSAMKFGMVLSDKEYDQFFYKLMLQQAEGDLHKIDRLDFDSKNWLHPTVISLLSVTLMLIMAQVNFNAT
jgi:hypothetical protein